MMHSSNILLLELVDIAMDPELKSSGILWLGDGNFNWVGIWDWKYVGYKDWKLVSAVDSPFCHVCELKYVVT